MAVALAPLETMTAKIRYIMTAARNVNSLEATTVAAASYPLN
ncbi:MAG: hypothetical protein QXR65_00275 [Candidatus Bathyarchaeia archaeon]